MNNFLDKAKSIFSDGRVFWFLSNKQLLIMEYFIVYKKFPNLETPKTINEKIQWLKLYGGLEKYYKYVDKLMVRKVIEKKIGAKYLVPLLGQWSKFEDINFDVLPKKFVLKVTHGSGYVFVCKDKSKLDMKELEKLVKSWMNENYYKKTREIQYKKCNRIIICEKYLEDFSGSLVDYKFYCSNGEPKFLEVHFDRFTGHKVYWTDMNYERLPVTSPNSLTPENIVKPKNFNDLVNIARKLSQGFPFIRVDLYSVKNKVYFGELTFIPAGGLISYDQEDIYTKFGNMIDLPIKIGESEKVEVYNSQTLHV